MTQGGLPGDQSATGLPSQPECPFCSTRETELFNAFGSQLSVSTYWCRTCRSPFEFMKWSGAAWTGDSSEGASGESEG